MVDPSTVETLVAFYSALADATRLKLIGLLALKPMCGSDLANELAVSAPTVSHHIGKLKQLNLVKSVREDNTVYYSLNTERLHQLNRAVFREEEHSTSPRPRKDEREKVLCAFFSEGKLKEIPVQRKKKLYVFEEILKAFDPKRTYTEQEVNDIIKGYFHDYCAIRREFIINGYMSRDKGIYRMGTADTSKCTKEILSV